MYIRPWGGRQQFIKTLSMISLICLPVSMQTLWPLSPKRFRGNSLLGAGSLGLPSDGRVVAFGDFNGDQSYAYFHEEYPCVLKQSQGLMFWC